MTKSKKKTIWKPAGRLDTIDAKHCDANARPGRCNHAVSTGLSDTEIAALERDDQPRIEQRRFGRPFNAVVEIGCDFEEVGEFLGMVVSV